MKKTKVLFIFGTRPEGIKMAPLVKAFSASDDFTTKICVTGQHREMLDSTLDFFDLQKDFDLNVMTKNQNLVSLTASILNGLKPVLDDFKPKYVFVQGDTTSTMAGSIAAMYSGAEVCHVEAGLRTGNKKAPFPEECNRMITGAVADWHFPPTSTSRDNLLKENIDPSRVLITGNTVIDALLEGIEIVDNNPLNEEMAEVKFKVDLDKKILLVTGHRRENHGKGFENICHAINDIAQALPDVEIVYPVHLNPNVQKPVYDILKDTPNVHLIKPLSYSTFIWLMNKSHVILTDSGGVQEEAPSLGKPVLVMRETTERPEAVKAGTVLLVGTDRNLIKEKTLELFTNKNLYESMSKLINPYGDGQASNRILKFIKQLEASSLELIKTHK